MKLNYKEREREKNHFFKSSISDILFKCSKLKKIYLTTQLENKKLKFIQLKMIGKG